MAWSDGANAYNLTKHLQYTYETAEMNGRGNSMF